MKIIKALPFLAISTLVLSGCSEDATTVITPIEDQETFVSVRVVHASPDAPMVDLFNGTTPISALADLDYQQSTGYVYLSENSYSLKVNAELPGGMSTEVLSVDATLDSDIVYNVLAIGDVADIEALLITNPREPVTEDMVRAQVVHGAPDAPAVDVYVTAPDAELADSQPLDTLEFREYTGQVEVPAGDYRIRIAPMGTTNVVFDSGTVALAAGSDLFITATQNIATGTSPVTLLLDDGTTSSLMFDANAQAEVRAIHAIADAPAVDVIAKITNADDIVLFDGAAFLGVTPYLAVDGGDYTLDVAADADNSVVAIDDAEITLVDGMRYSAIANNDLENADLDLVMDTGRSIITAAQVRIFHASPSTGAVDIYVTADGVIDDIDPAFTGVTYSEGDLAETGYVQLAEGDYVVTVVEVTSEVVDEETVVTETVVIETGVLSLTAGEIYTAIAVDGNMEGDDPQLILADDFL